METEQLERNLEKISLIVEAVNLTTLSLNDIQRMNIELSQRIENSTATLKNQLIHSLDKEKEIIGMIKNAISRINSTVFQISEIKRNVMNFGVYIIGIIFGIILSLVIPLMSRISIFLSFIWFSGTSYVPSNRVSDFIFSQRTYVITYIIIILFMLFFSVKNTFKMWSGPPRHDYMRWFY